MAETEETEQTESPPPAAVDSIGDLVLAGRQVDPDADVPVIVEDGSVRLVAARDVPAAIQQGWQVASSQQVAAARDAAAYETAGAQARTVAEGTLRGLTVGLSDAALSRLGVDMEGVRKRAELNPLAAGAGEVIGTIAPLVASGGSSALARGAAGAGLVPRAIAGAGGAVQRGLRAVAGDSVLARGAALAGAGAVEGGLYGVGSAISESAITDAPLTAERVLHHVGMGSVLGGAAGGVLGSAAGAIERTLVPKFREVFSVANVERFAEEHGLRQWAQGRGKAMFQKLRKDFGDEGPALIGRAAREEGLTDLIARDATWSEIHTATRERLGTAGRRIGETMRQIDTLQPDAKAAQQAASRIAKRAETEVLDTLKASGVLDDKRLATKIKGQFPGLWVDETIIRDQLAEGYARVGQRVTGRQLRREAAERALELREQYTPTFEALHGLRARVDDLAFPRGAGDATPYQKALQQLRGIMEDEITVAADQAAAASGGRVATDYTAQKQRYKTLLWLNKAAESNAASDFANRQFGLTDTIAGMGGMMSGPQLLGLVSGDVGVLGSVLVAGFSGALAGMANRYLRTQGQGLVGRTADRLLQVLRADERAAKDSGRAVRGFFAAPSASVAAPIVALPASETIAEGYQRRTAQLDRYAASTDQVLGRSLGDTPDIAPALHQELRAVTSRAHQFLEGKRPKLRTRPSDVWGPLDERQRVSDSAMARFNRYFDAVTEPRAVVRQLSEGRVSREAVEALQAVYPRVHAQLVEQVQAELATRKPGSLSKEKLVQLSYLLRTPLHPALDPQLTAMCQAVHAQGRKAAEQGLTPGQRKAPDLARAEASGSQRLQMPG